MSEVSDKGYLFKLIVVGEQGFLTKIFLFKVSNCNQ